MVDLAALARQMKAIGRKGSGKDYYEQYVAQGIQNGEARAIDNAFVWQSAAEVARGSRHGKARRRYTSGATTADSASLSPAWRSTACAIVPA